MFASLTAAAVLTSTLSAASSLTGIDAQMLRDTVDRAVELYEAAQEHHATQQAEEAHENDGLEDGDSLAHWFIDPWGNWHFQRRVIIDPCGRPIGYCC